MWNVAHRYFTHCVLPQTEGGARGVYRRWRRRCRWQVMDLRKLPFSDSTRQHASFLLLWRYIHQLALPSSQDRKNRAARCAGRSCHHGMVGPVWPSSIGPYDVQAPSFHTAPLAIQHSDQLALLVVVRGDEVGWVAHLLPLLVGSRLQTAVAGRKSARLELRSGPFTFQAQPSNTMQTAFNVDDIIERLLEVRNGRPGKQVQLREEEIRQLCNDARAVFMSQPNLLELEAPIKICGERGS